MGELNLSTSQLGTFNACARRWYYSYRRNWKDTGSVASDFGSCWHAAQDSLWMHASNKDLWEDWDDPKEGALFHAKQAFDRMWADKQPEPDEGEWRGPELAHEMLDAYVAASWDKITELELLATEGSFSVPVEPGLNSAGRLDKVVRDRKTGKVWAVDHKTSSAYSKDYGLQPRWWESFLMSPQVSSYIDYINREYGEKNVGGFIVDAALVHKKVRHFERRMFKRTGGQIKAFLHELSATKAAMDFCDERGYYAKNLGACNDFSGCPYQPICTQFERIEDLPADPPEWAERVVVSNATTEERLGMDTGARP